MRLKKVKNAETKIENSVYMIDKPQLYKGKFCDLFGNTNPIHIEVGMGKGDFIIGMALKYPEINFIGIEKFDSVIVRAIEKLEELVIPNLKLIRIDALELNKVFEKEVETIYLNFSDPWPKKRHVNRRLTSRVFLDVFDDLFVGKNHIIQKTDNRKLFEFSIISFNENNYHIDDISLDLYGDNYQENVPTEYESKFVSRGNLIYRIEVSK